MDAESIKQGLGAAMAARMILNFFAAGDLLDALVRGPLPHDHSTWICGFAVEVPVGMGAADGTRLVLKVRISVAVVLIAVPEPADRCVAADVL